MKNLIIILSSYKKVIVDLQLSKWYILRLNLSTICLDLSKVIIKT